MKNNNPITYIRLQDGLMLIVLNGLSVDMAGFRGKNVFVADKLKVINKEYDYQVLEVRFAKDIPEDGLLREVVQYIKLNLKEV